MTHDLKTWKQYFDEIWAGTKTFEVRKNDRDFKVGDELVLIETDWGLYPSSAPIPTGRTITKTVTYILEGGQFGIEKGYVVIAIQ